MWTPPNGATVRLALDDTEWIVVKRRLTAGEYNDMLERGSITDAEGRLRTNPFQMPLAQCQAYLVDWSPTDWPPIKRRPLADVAAALRALDPEDYGAVLDAVLAHQAAMLDERTEEKKRRAGANGSSPTSASPAAVAGAMSGSTP